MLEMGPLKAQRYIIMAVEAPHPMSEEAKTALREITNAKKALELKEEPQVLSKSVAKRLLVQRRKPKKSRKKT